MVVAQACLHRWRFAEVELREPSGYREENSVAMKIPLLKRNVKGACQFSFASPQAKLTPKQPCGPPKCRHALRRRRRSPIGRWLGVTSCRPAYVIEGVAYRGSTAGISY